MFCNKYNLYTQDMASWLVNWLLQQAPYSPIASKPVEMPVNTDVKEIADRYGFSDQSAFGKFFKKKTGLSPLAFRQRGNPLPVSFR